MNMFRAAGDISHVIAILILLLKICITKSCTGVSGRTQLLFLLTFLARYLDLATNFVSYYNTVMKIFFIVSTAATVALIFIMFRSTYDRKHDTLRVEFLMLPAFMLSQFINYDYTLMEVAWTFSLYLESVAILPQLFMIFKTGEVESTVVYYLLAMGWYRTFYICNWIHRYYYEGFYDEISVASGVVQTLMYFLFFFAYFRADKENVCVAPVPEKEDVAEKAVQPTDDTPQKRNFVRIKDLKPYYEKMNHAFDRLFLGVKRECFGLFGTSVTENHKVDFGTEAKPCSHSVNVDNSDDTPGKEDREVDFGTQAKPCSRSINVENSDDTPGKEVPSASSSGPHQGQSTPLLPDVHGAGARVSQEK